MNCRNTWIAFIIVSLAGPALAHSPEQELAFAQQLLADGQQVLSLLEHERFLFHHADHTQAPQAAMAASRLYLGYLADTASARRVLERTAAKHPGQFQADATAFIEFIEINSDYQGKPLSLYIAAEQDADHDRPAEAAQGLQTLLRDYGDSQLADDASVMLAKIQVEQLNQPDEALRMMDALIARQPQSPRMPEMRYWRAAAIEKRDGPTPQVQDAYRQIVSAYPDTEAARLATDRLNAIANARYAIQRTHEKQFVRHYEVVKSGYNKRGDTHIVIVEVSAALSEREIKATLEDALIAAHPNRKQPTDIVLIQGYFSYPFSEAGTARWTPDTQVAFDVKPRDTGDKVKDAVLDILRKR